MKDGHIERDPSNALGTGTSNGTSTTSSETTVRSRVTACTARIVLRMRRRRLPPSSQHCTGVVIALKVYLIVSKRSCLHFKIRCTRKLNWCYSQPPSSPCFERCSGGTILGNRGCFVSVIWSFGVYDILKHCCRYKFHCAHVTNVKVLLMRLHVLCSAFVNVVAGDSMGWSALPTHLTHFALGVAVGRYGNGHITEI